ncbi:MAG: SOS response-associated peptidase [Gammaproteobacteria bacterium]|nr:SOS response-associated peptidase [Gammaproteobacteria bacterium]NNF48751.1 SOS response-associated peptidase [Woeseiaceae bacterium]MBT8094596.1 SOS response-associated peptidase [Gammaproteobacteria bacterium]MBT8106361.1 SOS response-associated peptidase [Gammaproteobacteria bacterium]NNK26376.1 SOS response-associated peptidase [Woeseiaceae bacterium]
MCGRFAFYSPSEAAAALFGVSTDIGVEPRYNIAPTQYLAAIRNAESDGRELVMLRWGLVPFWAKDPAIGNRMINARAETVAEKPSYRNAYKHRRCIVLADGFYEWRRQGEAKTPYFISLASGQPFALAGLWENWQDKESAESLQTTTLITTDANEFMQPLHHRMPVILEASSATDWLAGSNELLDDVASITPPLQAWPVDRRVNNARNEGEDLVRAVGDVLS